MIEAILIAIIAAVILALIAVSVLRIIDSRNGKRVTSDVRHVHARDVIETKHPSQDVVIRTTESVANDEKKVEKRVRGFGIVGAGIFAVLAAKLASMQIFNQESYAKQANSNQYKTVETPAARGLIQDRHGRTLAYSENKQVVVVEQDVANDTNTLRKLSTILGIPYGIVRYRANNATSGAQSRRTISENASERNIAFILEHKDALPGVFVESRAVRQYPYGALAAHVLGYTGYPTEEEVANAEGQNLSLDVANGKSGIEAHYDSLLAGESGERDVTVDADGNIVEVRREVESVRGSDLCLTIDAHTQYVADSLLADKCFSGNASTGAVVCMEIETGKIIAMSSFPTYDPNQFTGGITEEIWDLYSKEESRSPMLNRAISSGYAPGSTMKAFSSMAGLHYKMTTTGTSYVCTGEWDGFNSGDVQHCWLLTGHGGIDLHRGIVVSCDVVFYEIAKQFYYAGLNGTNNMTETSLQDYYTSMFHLGQNTGIDLADEVAGRIPTPEWKAERWKNVPSEAVWRPGDYTNMIIGQGNVLLTPLQLTVAYGCVASGKIMKPHLVSEIRNLSGETVLTVEPEVVAEPDFEKEYIDFVREALHDVVINFVEADIQEECGIDISGKTGTAEHANENPDSLFVGYGPYDDPKYVCACVLQHGVSAQKDAAPIVANVIKAAVESEADANMTVNRLSGYAGEELITGENLGASVYSRED